MLANHEERRAAELLELLPLKQAQWFSNNQDQYKVTALSTQHTGVSSFYRGALACEVFGAARTSAQQSR
jgi:hypothetical protein